jgi:hypothetical protein
MRRIIPALSLILSMLISAGMLISCTPLLQRWKKPGSVTGRVTEAETGEPLPYTDVVMYRNGHPVTGCCPNQDGLYTLTDVPVGIYRMEFSLVGFKSFAIEGLEVTARKVVRQDAQLIKKQMGRRFWRNNRIRLPLLKRIALLIIPPAQSYKVNRRAEEKQEKKQRGDDYPDLR